jgi:hypothetical protein
MNNKIGICYLSVGDEYRKITQYSRLNKILYCKKYGYDFIEEENYIDKSKPIQWNKILLILNNISKYDYLVYIDADMLIMNDSIRIEYFIENNKDVDLIISKDWIMPNTGFMVIKNTEFCKNFFEFSYQNVYDENKFSDGRYLNYEQGSIIHMYDNNILDCKSKIHINEINESNSYWFNYFPGDFILHFAACRGEILSHLIRDYFPNRLPYEDDYSFNKRMDWLSGPVRTFLDNKLRCEKLDDVVRSMKILLFKNEEIIDILDKNKIHFEELDKIANNRYNKESVYSCDINKIINLFSISKLECFRNIIQVGIKNGHYLLIFLLSNVNTNIFCFDKCDDENSELCFNYLKKLYPDNIFLYKGDTHHKLSEFGEKNSKIINLVHINNETNIKITNGDFFHSLKYILPEQSIIIFNISENIELSYLWSVLKSDKYFHEINNHFLHTNNNQNIGLYLRNK